MNQKYVHPRPTFYAEVKITSFVQDWGLRVYMSTNWNLKKLTDLKLQIGLVKNKNGNQEENKKVKCNTWLVNKAYFRHQSQGVAMRID